MARLRVASRAPIRLPLRNLLLTVCGKGRKERRVPFGLELRRVLYRFDQIKTRSGELGLDVAGT